MRHAVHSLRGLGRYSAFAPTSQRMIKKKKSKEKKKIESRARVLLLSHTHSTFKSKEEERRLASTGAETQLRDDCVRAKQYIHIRMSAR